MQRRYRICWDFRFEPPKLVKCYEIWRFPKFWVPQNDKMDGLILLKSMIWGYPHFRKPPYLDTAKPLNIATLTNKNGDFI